METRRGVTVVKNKFTMITCPSFFYGYAGEDRLSHDDTITIHFHIIPYDTAQSFKNSAREDAYIR